MKKTDIAMIILIASISVLASYFIVKSIPIFSNANKPVTIQTIEPIVSDVKEVDESIFNEDAINPTVEVFIGDSDESDNQ